MALWNFVQLPSCVHELNARTVSPRQSGMLSYVCQQQHEATSSFVRGFSEQLPRHTRRIENCRLVVFRNNWAALRRSSGCKIAYCKNYEVLLSPSMRRKPFHSLTVDFCRHYIPTFHGSNCECSCRHSAWHRSGSPRSHQTQHFLGGDSRFVYTLWSFHEVALLWCLSPRDARRWVWAECNMHVSRSTYPVILLDSWGIRASVRLMLQNHICRIERYAACHLAIVNVSLEITIE